MTSLPVRRKRNHVELIVLKSFSEHEEKRPEIEAKTWKREER
jgi:hypothetical protein